ncbi:hypothetical protein P691DRAFT_270826 [Macrolepiota fuliginosa MF-IS2]|uniref:Uncharacterized protein n=1 Tax=Macrolepiota fuliginosa MF-IS2 TaxID=1400762 RepID=A0A9P5X847_9AGAR|nr:hypothetical protein P691DRAFT_270826 [Macrolepiota fuliginosa MF-IS2]
MSARQLADRSHIWPESHLYKPPDRPKTASSILNQLLDLSITTNNTKSTATMTRIHTSTVSGHKKRFCLAHGSRRSKTAQRDRVFSRPAAIGNTPRRVKASLSARALVKAAKRSAILIKKVMLFGGYAHITPWKVARIRRWRKLPVSNKPKVRKAPPPKVGASSPFYVEATKRGKTCYDLPHAGITPRHVKARQYARTAIKSIKHSVVAIKKAVIYGGHIPNVVSRVQHWSKFPAFNKHKVERVLPQPSYGVLPSGEYYALDGDGDVIMDYIPPVYDDTASLVDVEMGEPGEGWAEMDICDEDVYMEDGTQDYVGFNTSVLYPHTAYSSKYSLTSSTATLVDEDIIMADPDEDAKPSSMDILEAMFAAMDLNAKLNLPLIGTLCI